MNRGLKIVSATFLAIASASNQPAFAAQSADGKKLYRRHCGQCHGGQMRFIEGVSEERFRLALQQGAGAMPPMGKALTEGEIAALWGYVSEKLSGNPYSLHMHQRPQRRRATFYYAKSATGWNFPPAGIV